MAVRFAAPEREVAETAGRADFVRSALVGARIRADGRVIRDVHLARVKKPEQSKGAWDYFELLNVIKGDDAFRPVAQSVCPLLKKG